MLFDKARVPLYNKATPTLSEIALVNGVVHLSDTSFNLHEVITATVNFDPFPVGETHGSALFKAREFDGSHDYILVKYPVSFDGSQTIAIKSIIEELNRGSKAVSVLSLADGAFRQAFFD